MWDLNDLCKKKKLTLVFFFSSFITSGGANIFFEKPDSESGHILKRKN